MLDEIAGAKVVESVLRRLNVRPDGNDTFVGGTTSGGGPRLFGGQVAGQAVVAAARTVEEGLSLHSLHAYFLQPGDPALDVIYRVERIKEGRNFHARQVLGRQGDRIIFSMQASFLRPQAGFSHQDPMPDVPMPESLPDRGALHWGGFSPVQMRDCSAEDGAHPRKSGLRCVWMRPAAALPADPTLHLAMFVFMSDMGLVSTGAMPHPELRRGQQSAASLDHTLWVHHAVAFDDWMLFTMETPAATGSRPLVTGAIYRRDGTRLISVAQEGLFRPRR